MTARASATPSDPDAHTDLRTDDSAAESWPSTIRVRSAPDLLAAVPVLLGFHPQDSLVGVAVRQPDGEVALTVRVDVGPGNDGLAAEEPVDSLCRSLGAVEPEEVILVGYAEAERAATVTALLAARDAAELRGWSVRDTLLVSDRRWWSLCCDGPCCPVEGRVLDLAGSPVTAAAVASGRVVRDRRADLAQDWCCTLPPGQLTAARDVAQAELRARAEPAPIVLHDEMLERLARIGATRASPGHPGGLEGRSEHSDPARDAAWVALVLGRGPVRDECYRALAQGVVGVDEWASVLRRVSGELRAGPAGMLAMGAYLGGDGASATLAVSQALELDPTHPGATLVRDLQAHLVPPGRVRQLLVTGPPGQEWRHSSAGSASR